VGSYQGRAARGQDGGEYLGNTPTVCRKSDIDPKVIDRFDAGETIASTIESLGDDDRSDVMVREAIEASVIRLLDDDLPSAAAA
jgi:DNA topoisomerase IB